MSFGDLMPGGSLNRGCSLKSTPLRFFGPNCANPNGRGEPIAIGTASDPYEPAESQYRLTRQIIEVLRDFRNPAPITTKGVLVRRDVDVLKELSHEAGVQVSFSVGTIDGGCLEGE